MKKMLSLLLTLAMLLTVVLPCAAAETTEPDWSGVNVIPVDPMGPMPYGVNYPTESYYPHYSGSLPFHGNASYSMLWLNKMLLGCDTYIIDIYNVASTPLYCIIRRQFSGDIPYTIQPHSSVSLRISADPGEIVCMSFDAPSNFSGSVRCGC